MQGVIIFYSYKHTHVLHYRTGALQTGDRLLAINSVPTTGKTLEEAKDMLHSAGDLVTLKIARQDKPSMNISFFLLDHSLWL